MAERSTNTSIAQRRTAWVAGGLREMLALTLGTQVTDEPGNLLALQAGADKALEMIAARQGRERADGARPAGKVMLLGNGGSAAVASLIQAELCRVVGIRAMVFNEPAVLTALSNDWGYEVAFERLIELWADEGDLLTAISSSGRSANILRGSRAAKARGCEVLTFSGFASDNPLRKEGALNVYVPSCSYCHVEIVHAALLRLLTARLSPA